MRTKNLKYTSLKGLISKQYQFSLDTLRSGRMCHKTYDIDEGVLK